MSFSHAERSLRALELLAHSAQGQALAEIAEALAMPKSGAHRLLGELVRLGYAAQDARGGYHLTPRLISVAFRHLASLGTVDAAQPVLEGLAETSGELVRLSVTDGARQVFVAKAQGARGGLIYDPQMGEAAHLASMATGLAWLAQMSDAEAVARVEAQGLAAPGTGPNAPRDITDLRQRIARTRADGVAQAIDSSAPGMSALAAAITHPASGACLGTVSIGGPSARLTPARMAALREPLRHAARQLSDRVAGSCYFTPAARAAI